MKQYLDLLSTILRKGVEKESGRLNMPNTIGISNAIIKMNLLDGFPLLTTKKVYFKGIIHELLWFLRGDVNIKYLIENNVNIWNDDAFRWYNTEYVSKYYAPSLTQEEFNKRVMLGEKYIYYKNKSRNVYTYGDLGKVYGYQWRRQNGIDQINYVINSLKTNPYSRYHIINAWNASDFNEMALPPCHLLYHFIVIPLSIEERIKFGNISNSNKKYSHDELDEMKIPKFYLDLNMYQRSADVFLGVPFNLASMSTLLMIIAKTCNMIPHIATWIGGDTHLYVEHKQQAQIQLERTPYPLPNLKINKELNSLDDIVKLTIDDFELINYQHYDVIKANLFTGLNYK